MRAFGPRCTLGEGPLWHPQRERLFWFDIPAGHLHECDALGQLQATRKFREPASAAGWLDLDTLLVATASGLHRLDLASGARQQVIAIEADNPATRTNDGRIGPDGSFWFGTMARQETPEDGTYYRYHQGQLDQLIQPISVPNATCFSPDGKSAYLADTPQMVIWRWPLDGAGNPIGDRQVHIDLRGQQIFPDGAVCDVEGYLWNARWGSSQIARHAPDGSLDRVIDLPVSQPTCPAFGGQGLKTLYITSASKGLSEDELERQEDAGKTFMIEVEVPGFPEQRAVV